MAEFLLQARTSSKERLTDEERAKRIKDNPFFLQDYSTRNIPGDIIQVEINDKWGQYVCAKGAFYHLKVPSMKYESSNYLQKGLFAAYTLPERNVECARWFAIVTANAIAKGDVVENEQEKLAAYDAKLVLKGYLVAKHRYRIDISKLPQLQTNPVLTLTKNQFESVLIDKNGS